jgi:hypothetical protein
MSDQKPNHNSGLDEDSLHRIELIANRFGIARTEVVRQAAAILTASVEIAKRDDVVGLSALRAHTATMLTWSSRWRSEPRASL